jgi:ABC-type multidrug transport system ATPase subunit
MHDPKDPAAVTIRDLTVGYQQGSPVFEGFSADFAAGGLVLVGGGNGSGKSTLLEVCSGYLRPWRGSVRINGIDAGTAEARAVRRVCRTKQALYPTMTVLDHLLFGARCVGVEPGGVLARAERYGLHRWFGQDAKALSTGNSRKLWIMVCTLGAFDIVLLDEPFNGLDDEGSAVLRDEVSRWAADGSVLLIAHRPPAGLRPDRVFLVDHGQSAEAVLTNG